MPSAKLTPEEAYKFKSEMWEGTSNDDLMAKYQLNYQLVVGVRAGRMYAYVPWPDGSTGPMPKTRKEWLAARKRGGFITARALEAQPVATLSTDTREAMMPAVLELGFNSVEALQNHYKDQIREERRQRELAAHAAWLKEIETPEYKAKLAEINGRHPPRDVSRDDILDPEANERLDWDYILQVGGDVPMVEVANEGNDPALKEAIRVAFKLIGPRQWKQDHMLKLVYSIKAKIERYWEEFGGAPEIETNCFKLS